MAHHRENMARLPVAVRHRGHGVGAAAVHDRSAPPRAARLGRRHHGLRQIRAVAKLVPGHGGAQSARPAAFRVPGFQGRFGVQRHRAAAAYRGQRVRPRSESRRSRVEGAGAGAATQGASGRRGACRLDRAVAIPAALADRRHRRVPCAEQPAARLCGPAGAHRLAGALPGHACHRLYTEPAGTGQRRHESEHGAEHMPACPGRPAIHRIAGRRAGGIHQPVRSRVRMAQRR